MADSVFHTGLTRSSIQRDHALIATDSHVPVILPGWAGALASVLVSPEMGARFALMLIECEAGARGQSMRAGDETFVLVLQGRAEVQVGATSTQMDAGTYAFLPPGAAWQLTTAEPASLLSFSRSWLPLADASPPPMVCRALAEVPGEPFLGDPAARLQVLLPDDPAFDWGFNVFTFDPGATLPQVESHFMEHGLYLLAGQGVYRLGDQWYPVIAGDAIWMSAYLQQWFVASGKQPTRYIYCKEVNRAPLPV